MAVTTWAVWLPVSRKLAGSGLSAHSGSHVKNSSLMLLTYHANAAAEPVLAAWGIDTDGKPVFVGLDDARRQRVR